MSPSRPAPRPEPATGTPRVRLGDATRRQRGVSLVESLIVLATVAVTLGSALPSLLSGVMQRRLEGHAAQLETDILHLRSLAVAQNRNLRLVVRDDPTGSCYVVHAGPAGSCRCDARGHSVCTGSGQALRSVGLPAADGVRLSTASGSMVFEAHRGTVTPTATLRLVAADERARHVVVNVMGRVRQCAPAGNPVMPGVPRC